MSECCGNAPLKVTFTDTSTSFDGIEYWKWYINGKKYSGEQNPPEYTFEQPGTYFVKLSVAEGNIKDRDSYTENILVCNGNNEFVSGDIDCNGVAELSDAVIGLKILAGAVKCVFSEADINEDRKIGIEEVIYILQGISGL